MAYTKSQQVDKEKLKAICWNYLIDNFHKFNKTQQLHVALEITKRDMPQDVGVTDNFSKLIQSVLAKPDLPERADVANS